MIIPLNLHNFRLLAIVADGMYRSHAAVDAQFVGIAALISESQVA